MSYSLITAGDGAFHAYVAAPRQKPAAGIVLIQEIFGVNHTMREVADRLCREGYLVVCPDLFWRQEPGVQLSEDKPEEFQRAFQLYTALDTEKALSDLEATADFLRTHPACDGHVGALGYCLGGLLAFMMSAQSRVDCAVGYYGVGIDAALAQGVRPRSPLLLHVAQDDQFVPAAAQGSIHAMLDPLAHAEVVDYPKTNHAFARPGGEHYVETAARSADRRTAEFLNDHLRRGEKAAKKTTPA